MSVEIESTEEMVAVFAGTGLWADEGEIRAALTAVLAIINRDLAGPCPENFHIGLLASTQPLRCNLRAGHAGDHENGDTRWWAQGGDDRPERLRIALAHLAQAAEQYLRELCCVYHDANNVPCAPDDQGGYCCDNCPTLCDSEA